MKKIKKIKIVILGTGSPIYINGFLARNVFQRLLAYFGLYHSYRKLYGLITRRLVERYYKMRYKPIYYWYWSRDCDMCEVERTGVWYGGRKNFLRMQEKEAEWADGPFSYEEISREDYELTKNERYFRDRCLEAYENGNGRSIYV